MRMSARCRPIAASASLSDLPGGRLNEIVVATYWLWWLTASGVEPGANRATADSGTMVSEAVATAAPVEALPWPVVAMADCAAVRTALLAAVLAEAEVELVDALPAVNTVAFRASTVPLLAITVALAAGAVPGLAGGIGGRRQGEPRGRRQGGGAGQRRRRPRHCRPRAASRPSRSAGRPTC